MKTRTVILSAAVAVLAALVTLGGCKQEEQPAPPAHTHTEDMEMAAQTAETAADVEQKTCPVMAGNPINKDIFTEYKGKKVYFCCPECKPEFEKNPEKYLSKLPQFQE